MKKIVFIFIFIIMLVVVNPANAGTIKSTKISHNASCDIVLKDIENRSYNFQE